MLKLVSAGRDLETNPAYMAQRREMLHRNYKPVGVVLGNVDDGVLSEYIGKLRSAAESEDSRLVEKPVPTELVKVQDVDFGESGVSGHSTGKVVYVRSWLANTVRGEMALQAAGLSESEAEREVEDILSKPADHYLDHVDE